MSTSSRFRKFATFALIYNLLVVAWGVFLRAGNYGDGCGNHWPLCGDTNTPLMGTLARWIEGSHRISTALCGPIAIALVWLAWRQFPRGHFGRKAAIGALGMTLFEGGVGAYLVKNELVTQNDSVGRAVIMSIHSVSTFLLVGSLAVLALATRGWRPISFRQQGSVLSILAMGFFGLIVLGISGAVSALAHQIHKVDNVLEAAMRADTHWMVRLQPLHPLIAVSVTLYIFLAVGLISHLRPDANVATAGRWLMGTFAIQIVVGPLNILFDAPIVMQMVHLVLADINFLALTVLSVAALAEGVEKVEARPAPAEAPESAPLSGRPLVNAYIALTKPRVISLLLFTTLTAMIAAQRGMPPFWQFLAIGIGGYMAAGAANAINMVIDRDIDLSMKRTASRPTVTQSIPSQSALAFAMALAIGSFALLWVAGNLLTAVLALSGLVFYVVIYTLLLKRRTWHNIVIGGAAGAFPPLVGWAAVTNDLPPLALYLFAIIFVWTPVHFWALALMLKDDYAAAGIPMLPVVKGDRNTVNQIGVYTAVTVVVTMLPFLLPGVGWIYLATAGLLNAFLVMKAVGLWKQIDRPHASSLFHYSMLYLALLFLALAIDRSVPGVSVRPAIADQRIGIYYVQSLASVPVMPVLSSDPSEIRHERQIAVISENRGRMNSTGGVEFTGALSPDTRSRVLEQL